MSSHQSTQWFWSDWAGDLDVRRLTPAERGLWIDLLCLAAVGKPTGYVCDQRGNPISYEEIARFANCSPTEAESLIAGILDKGVGSRDRSGRLFNRRMTRQAEKAALKRAAGKLGAEQTRKVWKSLKAQSVLTEQNLLPQHLPGHVPRHREPSLTIPNLKTSTVYDDRGEGLGNDVRKRPDQVSKTELAEIYAKRRAPAE